MIRRKSRTVTVITSAVVILGSASAVPGAWAAACNAPARYASSSNTLYLTEGVATLSQLKTACPAAPLQESSPGSGVWQLNSDLVLQNGARLNLHSRADGGDVDELLLRSASSALKTEVSAITAQYGTLDLLGVKITSWDPNTGGPDTDTKLPTEAPTGSRGRAFIRALSYLDADGVTPRESRMDIVRSDLGYLGYNGAESYGISYKARGCGIPTLNVCNLVGVKGDQVDSAFHHNFMGTYTWGADAMRFTGNDYANNISYGLDPHDDSDGLLIDSNRSHNNGNHGIICSQRCDNLTITNNFVYDNGLVPYVGPADDDPTDNQVHGIMLHRGVTDTVIEGNTVTNQPTGAGIAVFDSSATTIRNNVLSKNKYGLRFSVGSRNVMATGNTITGTRTYAVYAFKGADSPLYTNPSGRSSDIVLSDNTLQGSGSDIVKIVDADAYSFVNNTITGVIKGAVRMERSRDVRWEGTTIASEKSFIVRGTSTSAGSARFLQLTKPITVTLDPYSAVTTEDAGGRLARVDAGVYSVVTPVGSLLRLTSALIGTSAAQVAPQPIRVTLSSGSLSANPTSWNNAGGQVTVVASDAAQIVQFVVGPVEPGAHLTATRPDGSVVASGNADTQGEFTFLDVPARTSAWTYTVAIR